MDVTDVFRVKCSAEPILEAGARQRGLHVIFAETQVFPLASENEALHRAFGRFVQAHGFVVFDGLEVRGRPNTLVSSGVSEAGRLHQDPFHTDVDTDVLIGGEESTTLLYAYGLGRIAPTYYSGTEDVRGAARKLSEQDGLPEVAGFFVAQFADQKHDFRLDQDGLFLRNALIYGFPEFTERVFDLIPPSRRYAVQWSEGDKRVVAHSNHVGGILHGRPYGPDTENVLMAHVLGMPRL